MLRRAAALTIQRLANFFPIISITGPRQSGKTTLAKMLFPHLPYVSFEDFDIRQQATLDPRKFLALYKDGAIFDEIQNIPILMSYMQSWVDNDPRKGRYIITGSQNFALNRNITQSLAGRVGVVTLLPLSLAELPLTNDSNSMILKGGYPALYSLQIPPADIYSSYIQTYLERDIRSLQNIGDLTQFHTFLKLCAGRVGQILNITSLAQDCSISNTTATKWLSILEASYIIFLVHPYYKNFNKRLTKTPKLYFYDTGLASYLLGLKNSQQIDSFYNKGSLFENLIILEILKNYLNQGELQDIYFWQDRSNNEIDLIAEYNGYTNVIEIKSGITFQPNYIKHINSFCELAKETTNTKSYLVYNGTQGGFYDTVQLVPFKDLQLLFSTTVEK